jgi:CpXC motif protein
MTQSYSTEFGSHCKKCGTLNQSETWVIVDVNERPDLAKAIRDRTLRAFICSKCGTQGEVDQSLLLFRETGVPVLLFGWANWTDQQRAQEQLFAGLVRLQKALADRWRDHWRDDLVPAPFALLSILIDRNLDADLAGFDEASLSASPPEIAAYREFLGRRLLHNDPELLKRTGPLLLQAQTLSECRTVLQEHPELMTDDAVELLSLIRDMVEKDGHADMVATADERLQLLKRSREVGIAQAITEQQSQLVGRKV